MEISALANKKRSRRSVKPDREHANRADDVRDLPGTGCEEIRRPYDTAELEKLPRPTEDDPPYRPWWVL
jgi:hypothetical protein